MFLRIGILIVLFLFSNHLMAEDKSPWTHESEASIVKVDGNTTSDSYSAKQKTTYSFTQNLISTSARYLQTKAGSLETAKQWGASLRYERELSDQWAIFLQLEAESDFYAGYIQRDNTDLGGKYYFTRTDDETFFAEAGLRYVKTLFQKPTPASFATAGRLYTEYSKKLSNTVSGKLWFEYLPNFKDSQAYLINYEPSLSVMMNQIFSLKVAYLIKYHNKTTTPHEKKEDRTFTTALVAKF